MSSQFSLVETTIPEIHDAMRSGELTAEELVNKYLIRIERFDRQEGGINSIVNINENAKDRAIELDKSLHTEGLSGRLHGIPLVVKDQAMTSDITTTFGSKVFDSFVPETDAAIVKRIREEGGIIIGKTAMNDWGAGDSGVSSIVGQTKNPYDMNRDPGGSSCGTGAAVAANLAAIGIGEDTGGSIRAPASCCNLFGIRVTTGLISRSGLSPLVKRNDTAGPMARTVDDLIRLLDVITGYDSDDIYTGTTSVLDFDSYEQAVHKKGLKKARIGVLSDAFGSDNNNKSAPVNSVVEDSLSRMAEAGSEIITDISIPNLEYYLREASLYEYQSKNDINSFLQSLNDPPVDSIDEIFEKGVFPNKMGDLDWLRNGSSEPTKHIKYWQSVETQNEFQREIQSVFAKHDLDAIAFPDVQIIPRLISDLPQIEDEESYLINTLIGSFSSCPAISMPGGFTDDRLPVGIELLGVPYSEHKLLSMASHYENISNPRKPPAIAPPVE